jgi:hypothetical protein
VEKLRPKYLTVSTVGIIELLMVYVLLGLDWPIWTASHLFVEMVKKFVLHQSLIRFRSDSRAMGRSGCELVKEV